MSVTPRHHRHNNPRQHRSYNSALTRRGKMLRGFLRARGVEASYNSLSVPMMAVWFQEKVSTTYSPSSLQKGDTMPGYTKLFSTIVTSTIWQEPPVVCKIWITMLALVDQNGEVHASIPGLAHAAGVSLQECEEALAKFLAPDPYSRSKDFEGRRIQVIDGGWWMVNHAKYREMSNKDEQRRQTAERMRRLRQRQRDANSDGSTSHVSKSDDIAEAEAEADTDTDTEATKTTATATTHTHADNSNQPPPGPVQPAQPIPATTPPAPPAPQPEQQDLHLQAQKPKKTKPPKEPKEPKPAAGARYPSIADPAKLVNAWTVWVDILRDRGFPDPILDPEDLRFSKTLGASIQSRTELEWIFNDYLNDDEDPWLSANFPHPGSRPLHFIRSKVARYRITIAKSKNPATGSLPTYNYGTFIKNQARPDPIITPIDALSPRATSMPPTPETLPDGNEDPSADPADAFLHELES